MERINDLGLAAALISRGFKLQGISRDERNRACFQFDESAQLDLSESAYWEGGFDVEARVYFDNIKMLKGRIYAGK